MAEPDPPFETLAQQWRPDLETVIEAFGANRCTFENNFRSTASAAETIMSAFDG